MSHPQITHLPFKQNEISKTDLSKYCGKIKFQKSEVRIVFFGTDHLSAIVLNKLLDFCQNPGVHLKGGKLNPTNLVESPKFTIQTVITQTDKPVGRHQTLTPSEVAVLAEKNGIPVLKPDKLNDEFIKNHLSYLNATLYIVAVYGKIFPPKLLEIPQLGSLNIHPSLLPKYRGPSPIQTAILSGDEVSGVTIIKMDEKMDHGPIIGTEKIILSKEDNFVTLSTKMFKIGAELLIKIIPDFIEGKLKPVAQDDTLATYCHIIKKEDGYFDIDNPPSPEQLDRMIRAYYPWPTAWTKWESKIIKFYPNKIIQLEGKKPVLLEDFLNGHPNFPIKQL